MTSDKTKQEKLNHYVKQQTSNLEERIKAKDSQIKILKGRIEEKNKIIASMKEEIKLLKSSQTTSI